MEGTASVTIKCPKCNNASAEHDVFNAVIKCRLFCFDKSKFSGFASSKLILGPVKDNFTL